ncbi:MAG: hypothetical protein L6R28_21080 [Planctomycetes bacterium]|nr:hypothetical protein [Planctomycetota bacterium]
MLFESAEWGAGGPRRRLTRPMYCIRFFESDSRRRNFTRRFLSRTVRNLLGGRLGKTRMEISGSLRGAFQVHAERQIASKDVRFASFNELFECNVQTGGLGNGEDDLG